MSDDAPGFLARWSRRKRAAEAEPDILAQPIIAEPVAESLPALPEPEPPAELEPIDLAALPRIQDLHLGSDLTAFLRPGIPSVLRSAALRRMWSLDPDIRDFVGPADYAWDYNDPAGLPPGFSLELGEDPAALLAQAIGQAEPTFIPPAQPMLTATSVPAQPVAQAADEVAPEPPRHAARRRQGGAMPS